MKYTRYSRIMSFIKSIIFAQSYVASAITASVIILVLLIVLQDDPPGPIQSILIIAWTVICINALRVFSNMVGKSIEKKRTLKSEERAFYLKELGYTILELLPLLVIFFMAYLNLYSIEAAYKVTIIVITGMIFTYGFAIIRFRTSNIVLCILGGIGFLLIALTLVMMRMLIS